MMTALGMSIDPATVLAVIPARGGSKGIPRKNLMPVGGHALVARSVAAARAASGVGRIVVSTDDDEIAEVARAAGAEVVRRPPALADDQASSEAALLHVLETLERETGYRPELLVFLQCTSPLTIAEDIDGTIGALVRDHADCALAVARCHHFLWRATPDGAAGVNHDPARRLRRQDREPEFVETGAVYVMRAAGFVRARHRFFGRIALHELPRRRWLEIDEPDDALVATALATHGGDDVRARLPATIAAVVFDFDGVFTDNRVYVAEDGRETVACDRGDGWGLGELRRAGVPMIVLSTETNPVVRARCAKLGLEVRHGLDDKLAELRAWAGERGVALAHVVYVGNDRNDVACLEAVGCGVVVADAHPSARAVARVVLARPGGHGAVREVTDLVLNKLGREP